MGDISFQSLRIDHNRGDRRIPIASLRESYSGVSNRQWQKWRTRCEVPKGARLISGFSAIKLWILAGSGGAFTDHQLRTAMLQVLAAQPEKLEKWLGQLEWAVGRPQGKNAIQTIIDVLNATAPHLDVIHRQRLYDWFRKAGLRFSTRGSYSRHEILRVVAVALRGVGLGRPRMGVSFF